MPSLFQSTVPAAGRQSWTRTLVGGSGTILVLGCMLLSGRPSEASQAAAPGGVVADACLGCLWSPAPARDLADEAEAGVQEGLPARTAAAADLRVAAAAGPSPTLDGLARATALEIAGDYLLGRVKDRDAQAWHMTRSDGAPSLIEAGLDRALRGGAVRAWLRSLLPSDPRYAALRKAYNALPAGDSLERDRVRINLERWRWLPRDLGSRYILVNVPAYTLAVIDSGMPELRYDVVVGAPATPTPQFEASARAVVLNPWWNVPASIRRSSRLTGRRGFVPTSNGIAQPPGPRNALGRVKVDMANSYAIYLHGTPAKALFARTSRAYSHGCIRVKDIDRLAGDLVLRDGGDAAQVGRGLASYRTASLPLRRPRPVYLVYFTAEVDGAGNLAWHDDPYGRDRRLGRQIARDDAVAGRIAAAAVASHPAS